MAVSGGTVYVADTSHERIVKLSLADGSQLGTVGVGKLHSTEGVASTRAATCGWPTPAANRLVEFSAAGAVLQTFGVAGNGARAVRRARRTSRCSTASCM